MKTTYKIVDLKQGEGGRPHTIYGSLYEGDTFIRRDDLMILGDVLDHAAHHAEVNGLDVDECIRERLQEEVVSAIPVPMVSAGPAYGAPPEVVSPSPAYGAPPAEGFPMEVTALLPSDSAVLEHLKDLRAAGFPMATIVDLKNQLKTGEAVVQKEVIRDWEGLTDFRLSVPYTGTFLVYAFTYLGKSYRLNYHDLPRFVREHDR